MLVSRLFAVSAALTVLAALGCEGTPATDLQAIRTSAFEPGAIFINGDFESGVNNQPPSSWTVTTYLNPGVTLQTPQTRAGLNLTAGGVPRTYVLVAAAGAESQVDPSLGAAASLRWPKFGNAAAIVNSLGNSQNVNSMKQVMTVGAGDIDPIDGLAHIRFVAAPVFQDPVGHPAYQQPYTFIQLTNITRGNAVLFQDFVFSNQPGVPWKTIGSGSATYRYTDWQLFDVAPGSALLAPGDQVELEIIAAGCSPSAHFGQLYVDSVGPSIPGLFVTGTAPTAVNENTNLTYTLRYTNGGAAPAGGVVVEFNTPPITTFSSFSAPGLACTAPAVGATGLVSCTVGTLAAGASGSFTVTVHVSPASASMIILAANYAIYGTAISPLLGPKLQTIITAGVTYADLSVSVTDGATSVAAGASITYDVVVSNAGPSAVTGASVSNPVPAQLTGFAWSCTGAVGATCTASGIGAINDAANLPVGGSVTYSVTATVAAAAAAGQLAEIANVAMPPGALDLAPSNNSAADYDRITVANGVACTSAIDCTSATCDPADSLCGWAAGHGPCSAGDAGIVCRSLACSADFTCMPAGGCNVVDDCTGGGFCEPVSHGCVACLVDDHCSGTTPVCDATGFACRGCTADPECSSPTPACQASGACATCSATQATECAGQVCDPASATCVDCMVDGDCSGATPVCELASNTCVAAPPPAEDPGGCGCRTTGGLNDLASLGLGLWAFRLRRRPRPPRTPSTGPA